MNESVQTLPPIQILLPTYNGERYLREQLDSLVAQTYPSIEVLLSDDGSSDGTISILQTYRDAHPTVFRWQPKPPSRSGARDNYLHLLRNADAPYVAFCDQDDIWNADKLQQCMQTMLRLEEESSAATPCLVFTDLTIVDSVNKELFPSLWKQQAIDPRRTDLRHLLVQKYGHRMHRPAEQAPVELL